MRNRKNYKSFKTVLVAILAIMFIMPTAGFAETLKSVEVGYDGNWQYAEYDFNALTDQEKDVLTHEFMVSNVVNTFEVDQADSSWFPVGIVAKGPVQITHLKDYAAVFGVYKVTKTSDNYYEYSLADALPVEGTYIDEYLHVRGNTVTITEPGEYLVNFRYEALAGSASAIIRVEGTDVTPTEVTPTEVNPAEAVTVKAVPTNAKVLVNSENVSFNAYTIAGNNYFKLRDLASVVNATEKQFEVVWDQEKRAINLISGDGYTPDGKEMTKGDGLSKTGTLNTSQIYKDGSEVKLTAYNINGNNFFKLRDVAQLFDIGITWDGVTKTIGIDTSIGYTAE